jgi:hypothetical protein
MIREKSNELISWKQNHNRKPLIVNGVRQIRRTNKHHFVQIYWAGQYQISTNEIDEKQT